jgi:dTDP-4-dehydrorhamnose 3,5-epimerase
MDIKIAGTDLGGVLVIEPDAFTDERGFFFESYSRRRFASHGIDVAFVQDNHSRSRTNVVRGLHYQGAAAPQWRLVRCTVGEILDVVVDLRIGSPTLGRWIGVRLAAEDRHQLLIPPPFAHGFVCISEHAEVQYKCSGFHDASAERALAWDDPDIAIEWPLTGEPILSRKDAAAPSFKEYLEVPDFPDGWERVAPPDPRGAR